MVRARSPYAFALGCGGLLALVCGGVTSAEAADPRLIDPAHRPGALAVVDGTTTLAPLRVWGSLAAGWADDELVGTLTGADGRRARPLEDRVMAEVFVGLGLLDWLQVDVALPIYAIQTSTALDGAEDSRAGVGDLRLVPRARFLGDGDRGFGLGASLAVTVPTGSEDLMGDAVPTVTPVLVADWRGHGFALALNVGFRWREEVTHGGVPIGSELRLGFGIEAPTGLRGLSLTAETLGVLGLASNDRYPDLGDDRRSPVEILGGFRWRHASGFTLHAVGGGAATDGYGAADYRALVTFGVGYPLAEAPAQAASEPSRPPAPGPDGVDSPGGAGTPGGSPVAGGAGATLSPAPTGPIPDDVFDRAVAEDPDPDGDAIAGAADKCPHEPEDPDGFEDADGCPEADNDRDGVPDAVDQCPAEPEVINGVDDDDGCPDAGAASGVRISGDVVAFDDQILFRSGSDVLDPRSFTVLDQVAGVLKANPQVARVLVEGHTDSAGNMDLNVYLSERRARRVMGYLIDKGVDEERLSARGFGPTKPVADNRTSVGRAANRRVEFRILEILKPGDRP